MARADDPSPRVRPGGGPAGVLVVGVDGSEASRDALRWALTEARLREARLVAVHVWLLPPVAVGRSTRPPGWTELERSAREVLDAALEAVGGAAGVEVELWAVEGTPAEALVAAAEGADLLVVGSRGLGGIGGLLLGSVSRRCARDARCPVVIVRHSEPDDDEPGGGR